MRQLGQDVCWGRAICFWVGQAHSRKLSLQMSMGNGRLGPPTGASCVPQDTIGRPFTERGLTMDVSLKERLFHLWNEAHVDRFDLKRGESASAGFDIRFGFDSRTNFGYFLWAIAILVTSGFYLGLRTHLAGFLFARHCLSWTYLRTSWVQ